MCVLDKHTDTHSHTPHQKNTRPPKKETWEGACAYWPLQGGVAREQDATEHARARGLPPPLHNSQAAPRAATRGRHALACCPPFGGRVRDPQGHLGNFNCAPAVFKRPHFCFSTNHAPHSWSKFRNTPGTCEYGGTGHLGPRGKERTPKVESLLGSGVPRVLKEEGLGVWTPGSEVEPCWGSDSRAPNKGTGWDGRPRSLCFRGHRGRPVPYDSSPPQGRETRAGSVPGASPGPPRGHAEPAVKRRAGPGCPGEHGLTGLLQGPGAAASGAAQ